METKVSKKSKYGGLEAKDLKKIASVGDGHQSIEFFSKCVRERRVESKEPKYLSMGGFGAKELWLPKSEKKCKCRRQLRR